METRIENWNGYDIRFVNLDGDWYAVLKTFAMRFVFKRKMSQKESQPNVSRESLLKNRIQHR